MTDHLGLIAGIAALSLSTASVIETSSWWVKGSCPPDKMGLYINRANIYMYFGRFFILIFTGLIAFAIEKGATPQFVATALSLSFSMCCLIHVILLRGGSATLTLLRVLDNVLILPDPIEREGLYKHRINRALLIGTASSNFVFTLSFTVPLQLAVAFPTFRLSLSYTGQIINAVGTIYLLFYVDQRLFKSMDNGDLHLYLPSYSYGRTVAFAAASAMCAILSVFV